MKGHVYVVGTTNAGKSTLFNALLMSDYCKSTARDFINRATVSVWPGTTLNLLKFPIVNPAAWRLQLRSKRLMKDEDQFIAEEKLRRSQLMQYGSYKASILTGHIGVTDFRGARRQAEDEQKREERDEMEDLANFKLDKAGFVQQVERQQSAKPLRSAHDVYNPDLTMHWCHDTPGVVNSHQLINLLEANELLSILPKNYPMPRVMVVKPGQVVFLSGMGRVDYVEGSLSIYITAYVAHTVKLHVMDAEEADIFYQENLGTETLNIPLGDEERLWKIPSLSGREFHLTGEDWKVAVADIQLSSLGWVSVAAFRGREVTLRAYTPGGKGLQLRSPALLPNFMTFRGKRKGKTPFYNVSKPVLKD